MNRIEIQNTVSSIRKWLMVIVPVVFFIEFAHYFLRGRFKFVSQYIEFSNWQNYVFGMLTMTVLPALFIWFSGAVRISTRNLLVVIFAGGATAGYLSTIATEGRWIDVVISAGLPLGVFLAFAALYHVIRDDRENHNGWSRLFGYVLLLTAVLAVGMSSFLEITPAIFPGTYDYPLYHVDMAFGNPSKAISSFVAGSPDFIRHGLNLIYDLLGWIFIPLIALVLRERKDDEIQVWRAYIYALGLAMLCYSFIPVSGPLYAFGPKIFPEHMDRLSGVPTLVTTIQPALRNGMPSMHFTSAVTILFLSAVLRRKIYFFVALIFLVATFFATMGFGEHYLIDLIVAMPYSVLISVLLIAPKRYFQQGFLAKVALLLAALMFVIWMALIKFQMPWLIANLNFVKIFSFFSFLIFLVVSLVYFGSVWRLQPAGSGVVQKSISLGVLPEDLRGHYWVIGVFFASGVAGLIYEVVFAKALAVTFGASSLATNTVLATYMGGMALGAWVGAKLAERSANPLRLYVVCEMLIGLYALLTPTFFQVIQRIYIDIAMDKTADALDLTILRLMLGALVLGPATILMGATFPIMFARLRQIGVVSERAIAPLYAANVSGAALGALFAGYALIPAVGKNSATFVAALISLLVALYALEKDKNQSIPLKTRPLQDGSKGVRANISAYIGMASIIILALGGAVTMGLEVLFMHMLAVVAGNSVYAFGLMLATFLLGLGVGSAVGEKIMAHIERQNVVIIAQSGLGIAIVVSSLQWDALAEYFSNFGGYAALGLHIDFGARELIRAIVCALVMMPSAIFIGMSYPACMSLATDWLGRNGREISGLGKASGINTVGNISGVLLAGFWLLPAFGSRDALFFMVLAALGAAVIMASAGVLASGFVHYKTGFNVLAGFSIVFLAGFITIFPEKWNLDKLSEGSNVYFYPQKWGRVIDHAESAEGGLTTVTRSSDGLLTLLTNGKFQGNNAEHGEMVAQKSFALIPLMHTSQRESALVIGYGTGMTSRVVHEHGFRSLDIAELSEDMVRLADRYFENINHAVTSKPGVNTYYTDGRNFLLTQSKKYDLISIEISSIWFAGAANLYNKEFYDLVAKRLNNGGVLQQWIQLHHMQPIDFLHAMQSLRSSFRYVWFYVSGGQGIVVASNDMSAGDVEVHKKLLANKPQEDGSRLQDLENQLVADPRQIDAMFKSFDPSMRALLSTDNNLYLEYATPKGNAVAYDTTRVIMRILTAKYDAN